MPSTTRAVAHRSCRTASSGSTAGPGARAGRSGSLLSPKFPQPNFLERVPMSASGRCYRVLCAVLLLAACGGGDDSSGPSGVTVARVVVSPTAPTLEVGGTVQLSASVQDASGKTLDRPVTWASSNPSVADVAGAGTSATVTAKAGGGATISASAGGQTGTASVTVNNPVPVLTTLAPTAAAAGGAAFTLTATGSGFVNGAVVRWNSQNRNTTFVSATELQAAIANT
ncbi:MAG: Ig domain-containing protein, partial [Gemmatimonadetes bacterium]|nr:Ig domain-containing protein [Gemmatimonadota bacterium]